MHAARCFAVAVALGLISATAAAAVTEPNGLQVPTDSSPEVQLSTLFQNRGEAISAKNDAHTTPNKFSPLCGFTATYVLNQAGSHYGLAWYNDTGQTPQASALHALVPPNSAVGTTFSGTVIKNDPAYQGGLVGFALVGGETHYSDPAYDTLCSGCLPAGPWITALIYASTATPNAFYICFEDGGTNAFSWNNDGDFNDDVYFVTGLTCAGGGQPCDTGKTGICAAGLTQCTATGTTCKQLTSAAARETCNGLDDDCNGQIDEGNPCPAGKTCDKGTCSPNCTSNEFPCANGLTCSGDGRCVDPACATVSCAAGQVCRAGVCKAACDSVTCPHPQVCRVGACVDPCAGVTCESGQVCEGGVCVLSCGCQPCAQGKACNAASGHCVESACATVTCGAGTYCAAGKCVDDCAGAVCPSGLACAGGTCRAAPSADAGAGVDGGGGLSAPPSGGEGDAGATPDGSQAASSADFGAGRKQGCSCRAGGGGSVGDAAPWMLVAILLAARGKRARAAPRGRRPVAP